MCMSRVNKRFWLLILLAGLSASFMLMCADDLDGPENGAPVIDTILTDPDAIHPGADVILSALATDPEGDSLTYRWYTYLAAAKFSDTTSPVCTMIVSTALQGGMSLPINLEVSDGSHTTHRRQWISIVSGTVLSGHVYYSKTSIPIPLVEVAVNRLADTTSYKGGYLLNHVPPGERTLNAYREGCDYYSEGLSITDSMIYDFDMICPELTSLLSGTVSIFDGTPAENVELRILHADSTPTGLADTTGPDGSFSIDLLPPTTFLLTIFDLGNPLYDLDADTMTIYLTNDSNINITGRIFTDLLYSPGIDSSHLWTFEPDDPWDPWKIDTPGNCYSFNSCYDGNFGGKIGFANSIIVPFGTVRLAWDIEIELTDADCQIEYKLDGTSIGADNIATLIGDSTTYRRIINFDEDPSGKTFSIAIYTLSNSPPDCGIACLKGFRLYSIQ